MAKELTSEEIEIEKDVEERTTPFGFYTSAESYWQAAQALVEAKVRSVHPEYPIRFLYYHALELYLKSYLRLKGHSAKELAHPKKFGHDIEQLTQRAQELGLTFETEDKVIFRIMAETDAVIRARYHKTAAYYWPTIDGLDRVCNRLREPIREAMRKAGFPAR